MSACDKQMLFWVSRMQWRTKERVPQLHGAYNIVGLPGTPGCGRTTSSFCDWQTVAMCLILGHCTAHPSTPNPVGSRILWPQSPSLGFLAVDSWELCVICCVLSRNSVPHTSGQCMSSLETLSFNKKKQTTPCLHPSMRSPHQFLIHIIGSRKSLNSLVPQGWEKSGKSNFFLTYSRSCPNELSPKNESQMLF